MPHDEIRKSRRILPTPQPCSLPGAPSFDLAIADVNAACLALKGNRPDTKAVENLIDGDPKPQLAVHGAYALASHIPAQDKSAAFPQEFAIAFRVGIRSSEPANSP